MNKQKQYLWTDLELKGLIEDEDSCVYWTRIKKHFALHPFQLKNTNRALNEILSTKMNFYDKKLSGFALLYQNPKLLTDLGDNLATNCLIHIDVEVEYYIFRPEIGKSLKGIVNKKGINHIRVLVHKAFNVSIQKPNMDEEWIGEKIFVGQEIRFTITYLDFQSKLPIMQGTLDPKNYLEGCKLFTENEVKEEVEDEQSILTKSKPEINKKKKKKFDIETNEDLNNSCDINAEINNEIKIMKKEKKKNKKKSNPNSDQLESEHTNITLFQEKSIEKIKFEETDINIGSKCGENNLNLNKEVKEHLINESNNSTIESTKKKSGNDTESFNTIETNSLRKKKSKKNKDTLSLITKSNENLKQENIEENIPDLTLTQNSESSPSKSKKLLYMNETKDTISEEINGPLDDYCSETEKNYKKRLQDKLFNANTAELPNDQPSKKKLKKKYKVEQNDEHGTLVTQDPTLQIVDAYNSETEKKYKKKVQEMLFHSTLIEDTTTNNTITGGGKKDKKCKKQQKLFEEHFPDTSIIESHESVTSQERQLNHVSENIQRENTNLTDSALNYPDSDCSSFSVAKARRKKFKEALKNKLAIPCNEENESEISKKSQKRKLNDSPSAGSKIRIDSEQQPVFLIPKIENIKKIKKNSKDIQEALNGLENVCLLDTTPAAINNFNHDLNDRNDTLTQPNLDNHNTTNSSKHKSKKMKNKLAVLENNDSKHTMEHTNFQQFIKKEKN